ncbi:MAG: CAP domain-containing protein [Chthoniobacterales bacterium]
MPSPDLRSRFYFLVLLGGLLAASFAEAAPVLYSIGDPTGVEQFYLEEINRARANPADEGTRIAATAEPDLLSALQYLGINLPLFSAQMSALPTAPPLAFNEKLLAAARAHAADMLANAFQDHTGSDGSTPGTRISAQGYDYLTLGENVFAYEKSVSYGHAAFEIDWGGTPANGGMLVPPGHRLNVHNALFREVGVGVIDGSNGSVGPQLVTQDYAVPRVVGAQPLLTGVVYTDQNGNGFYDPGEGVAGVTVTVARANYFAVTGAAGGYAVPLPNDGSYAVTFSGGGLPDLVKTVVVTLGANVKVDYVAAAVTLPPRLANISTRLNIGTGDNAMIGGFIITGTEPKEVLIRGLGPSLNANGVPLPGTLANPTLELRDSAGQLVATNDNWQTNANAAAITASGVAPPLSAEAALLVTLRANGSAYTAIVRGVGETTGLGLVEIYDLAAASDSQLANISTRGLVQSGDNVLIGGLIITGGEARVIVRAIGPSLGLSGQLADPTLELFDQNGVSLGKNDNWQSDQKAEILASQLAPVKTAEAALLRTLRPGAYTAIVRGASGGSGIAVVEAYSLP